MWDYISYLLISITILSFGFVGCIKINLKTLEWEIESIKDELKKKPELTEAEKEWLSIADRYIWEQRYKKS